MTSLAEERAEQQKWTARLKDALPAYDRLVDNEFETQEQYRARTDQSLAALFRFASREVPHYRGTFRRAGVDAADADPLTVLAALPILRKLDVHEAGEGLLSENLPAGERVGMWWTSSGTTGRAIRVLHTKRSIRMHELLAQRVCRWQRLDPSGTFAEIRHLLPLRDDGTATPIGETARLETWRDMPDFKTGPYAGISVFLPVDELVVWLDRERPDYLMTYPETLVQLALAAGGERPVDGLKTLLAISQQLTPGMRAFVERRFQTPVHQVYGLAEIGVVAVRCEAGRYHVNREHCFVEIVDEKGRACAPGETGRIVVTGFSNLAMPLIRYDTDDLAETMSGECPCNRTSPSFGDIVGRHSRIASLPEGTMAWVMALRRGIEEAPVPLTRDLRAFQIHQFTDRRMELRLVARAALPEAFLAHIRAAWAKASALDGEELTIRMVDAIAKLGPKPEAFTSDFLPPHDETPAPSSLASRAFSAAREGDP